MLVLRRKLEEGILIGGNVKVRILGMEGDSVKVGVEAPKEVDINRISAPGEEKEEAKEETKEETEAGAEKPKRWKLAPTAY